MPRFSSLADDSFSGEKKKKETVKLRSLAHISADGSLTYPLIINQTASVTAQKNSRTLPIFMQQYPIASQCLKNLNMQCCSLHVSNCVRIILSHFIRNYKNDSTNL